MYSLSDYDFYLPDEFISQNPSPQADAVARPGRLSVCSIGRLFCLRDRGLKAEGRLDIGDVVVDRFRDANHAESEPVITSYSIHYTKLYDMVASYLTMNYY